MRNKIGSNLNLKTNFVNRSHDASNRSKQYTPMGFTNDLNQFGNIKIQRKITANLNPLVSKSLVRNTPSPINHNEYEEVRVAKPKRATTKLLSITPI